MLVTLDIKNESMKDSFLNFIKTLDYIDIKSNDLTFNTDKNNKNNNKPNNKFHEFAGMWSNSDITLEKIRKVAWEK